MVGVAYAVAGAMLLGLALDEELFVAGFLLVGFGLAISIGKTLLLSSVHVGSPDTHRHHVLSLYLFVTAAATPVAALAWDAIGDRIGINPVVGGAGVLLILAIAAGLVSVVRHHAPALSSAATTMAVEKRRSATTP